MPQIMMSAVGDEIVALCITFLRSSEYIKNPYLKSSLVTVLFAGTFPMYHLSRGILGDILVGSEFANEHLLHALMKFYIGTLYTRNITLRAGTNETRMRVQWRQYGIL